MSALVDLLPHVVNGVSLGLLFALMALGFMLIVGVMETINLAHGSFFALGMYVALLIVAPPGDPAWLPLDAWKGFLVVVRAVIVGHSRRPLTPAPSPRCGERESAWCKP